MDEKVIKNQREYRNAVDMLEGCKNRICVTDDLEELKRLRDGAHFYIDGMFEYRKAQIESVDDAGACSEKQS